MKREEIDPDRDEPHALVSALVDGELRGAPLARALGLLEASEPARAHWHACQVAGDVLRSPELAAYAAGDAAFVARLRERLRQEAPRAAPAAAARPAPAAAAANDASRPWKLAAGFASLAALSVLAWHLSGADGGAAGSAQLAQRAGSAPETGETAAAVMIRDPRLDQLLAAHRQAGGASALQMPAGFLRNATYERSAAR